MCGFYTVSVPLSPLNALILGIVNDFVKFLALLRC